MPPRVAKQKIETLLLASEMPISIPRSRTVLLRTYYDYNFDLIDMNTPFHTPMRKNEITDIFDHFIHRRVRTPINDIFDIPVQAGVGLGVHAHTHICTHLHTHAHTHAHTRTHTRTHAHTHTRTRLILNLQVLPTSFINNSCR